MTYITGSGLINQYNITIFSYMTKHKAEIGFFEKYLTIWVMLCITVGILVGRFLPGIPDFLSKLEYARVSIPIALLIWLMIFPMMLKVDFSSISRHVKQPKGLAVTLTTNWLIKPFTMYAIFALFFLVLFKNIVPTTLAKEYLAGAVLLGAAPCTAMVFVWSHLTKGNPEYTVLQVAVNDLIILIAFTPIVALLLGVSNIKVPYDTLFLSVALFVVIPLAAGHIVRKRVIRRRGNTYFNKVFLGKFSSVTVIGLLLTLIILFSFQGEILIQNPLHILLIAIPLIIQTVLIFFVAYLWARFWKIPFAVAAPAGMIGASNFFELAVAVAVALFGLESGAALVTVVGVLVEVPVMLMLVRIANATKHWFPAEKAGDGRRETGDGRTGAGIMNSSKRVLVVCVHNSARSQMAEEYIRKFAGQAVFVESAGLEPDSLNPHVIAVLLEDEIDISGKKTQSAFDLYDQGCSYDYVITVCSEEANERCPIFPGIHGRLHWPFPDPSALKGDDILDQTREIREMIKKKVLMFVRDAGFVE